MTPITFSRRSFLVLSAMLPWASRGLRFPGLATAGSAPTVDVASNSIPIGLELYSVRDELQKDPFATVRAVAQMGYQVVEFYAPYMEWSEDQTKQMRKLMDDLGIRCYSTHNDEDYFSAKNIERTRDHNLILGSKYVVQAWSDPKPTPDGWKTLASNLNAAAQKLEPAGLKVGYHNHDAEWKPVAGQRPMDILARNTQPAVMLQLDVGTCLEAGADPVAWIRANPGRIRSIHLKDWSPDPNIGYKTLFGEGKADWKGIFRAAESEGGVEYYLIEQEGSRYSELETARRCLEAYRKTHA
ncbi:Xylose isomerase domain protein TIM barrel [Candidatus Sulfotelmatobacter kueseliae]|uniref:Xylose isomerase domain protein TIM barrel n=1 Tax=Candidatus Sulfotelmatobacter kueseliae TaxID=2042962 RepID=A0A2U3L0Z4_9BACT|nr:Xylose isomerase domain protein TIM barrel [Candidatus Sulfotelmatobacter kueseliae]